MPCIGKCYITYHERIVFDSLSLHCYHTHRFLTGWQQDFSFTISTGLGFEFCT